ncbi:MAG: ABC transporter ATP-binding protein [Deltaproteobacteria bacterium]|nr:ABC transporter ATP-binding protein [Deltaproteobacteria bacterium]
MIELKDVRRTYRHGTDNEVHAVREATLSIAEGEFLAIVGPSGSGKSTLMNLVGCLDRPDGGSYRLGGVDILGLDDAALSRVRSERIGFVFQQFHLLPGLTAVENVELPMLYRRGFTPPRSAKELLARVGLGDRGHHRPGELSGGQQQRVAIARALIGDPRIVLADEPTGNLDGPSGAEVLGLLAELNREGRTVILVTHNPEVAARTKRTVRIEDGRIVADSGASRPAAAGAASSAAAGAQRKEATP